MVHAWDVWGPIFLSNCFVEFLLHFAASTAELRARLARQAAGNRSRRLELNMKVRPKQLQQERQSHGAD